jgi:hypothetical protein
VKKPTPSQPKAISSTRETRKAARQPTQYRVQYLDSYSSIIAERHAYANDFAGALALIDGLAFPTGSVRMRILDAEGHLLYPKDTQGQDT